CCFRNYLVRGWLSPVNWRKSEEMLRKAASMAVCKINIDSDLRLAFTGVIRKHFAEHPDHFDPRQYLSDARAALKGMVRHKIVNVLGCNNKG
ncbi:MAG TPA: class II fructose-bisphosphate aldolase, partial [Clostridia bacterium]|nr:class II fructose-bisphosphate aldolase [Clostridia bacterium]